MAQPIDDDLTPWYLIHDINALVMPQEAKYFNTRPTTLEIDDLISKANSAVVSSIGRSKQAYGARIQPFLMTMAQFSVVAPIEYGEIIWGAVKLIVTRALSSTEHLRKIIETLEEISCEFAETNNLILKFPAKSAMYQVFSSFHRVLLEYVFDILKILKEQNSSGSKRMWKILSKKLDTNKKLRQDLKLSMETEAQRLAEDSNRSERNSMGLYRQEKIVYYVDEVPENWNNILEYSKSNPGAAVAVRQSLCTRICGYDNEISYRRYLREGSSHTLDWITAQPEFLDRSRYGSKKPLIWIYGPTGSGKSSISAYLIHMLKNVSKDDVFYFFCTPEIPESMQIETILRSLLQQLLQNTDHIGHIYPNFDLPMNLEHIVGTIQQIIKFRHQWIRNSSVMRMFIVIDGLNNLAPSEETELVSILESLCWLVQLKIIVTNKKGPPVHRVGFAINYLEQLGTDVVLYIENEVDMSVVNGSFRFDKKLVSIVKAAITGSAGKNFLLASLHLSLVRYATTEDSLLSILETLPNKIVPTYNLILNTIKSQGDKVRAKQIFNIIGVAGRSITLCELSDYLNWNSPTDNELPAYSPTSILDACKGLVVSYENNGMQTVCFVHSSVKDYLIANRILDEPRAHLEVARNCLSYLMQDTFRKHNPNNKTSDKLSMKGGPPGDPDSLDYYSSDSDTDGGISSALLDLRVSASSLDIEHFEAAVWNMKSQNDLSAQFSVTHPFLAYAQNYWLYHTRTMHKSDPSWSDFRSLVTERRKLTLDIIPWTKTITGAPILITSRKQYRLLANDWANRMKHFALSRLVVDWATPRPRRINR